MKGRNVQMWRIDWCLFIVTSWLSVCLSGRGFRYLCIWFSPARYSWCSKRLIEERYTWSNQLNISDLIPLETPKNSVRPPGNRWKERLIVGHNVSFDRSFIKEQYLLKVKCSKGWRVFPSAHLSFSLSSCTEEKCVFSPPGL